MFGLFTELAATTRAVFTKAISTATGALGFSLQVGLDGIEVDLFVDTAKEDFQVPLLPPSVRVNVRRIEPFFHPVSGGPPATAHTTLKAARSVRVRATEGGHPIVSEYGTVSAFARAGTGPVWLISANHVISENGKFSHIAPHSATGVPLDTAGDDGVYVNGARVSVVTNFINIVAQGNVVDVASARLNVQPAAGPLYAPTLGTGIPWPNPPRGTRVVLYCVDGPKYGTVDQESYDGVVEQAFTPTRPEYVNLILLRVGQAVEGGNSGSLVAAWDTTQSIWRPIGILTAKSHTENLAIACRLGPALERLSGSTGSPLTAILTQWP